MSEIQFLENKAGEIRFHIIDMIYKAKSGHPGGSLSAADIVSALYFKEMKVDPENPDKYNRDRFVLSKGHACPVHYSALALKGYFPKEELNTFRTIHSILQGHPDMKKTPGVDMTTGSLGLGVAAALGMAVEGKVSASDHRVFVMAGDGELNEGVVWESLQMANRFKLDNLVLIVDANGLQLDGPTDEVMPQGDLAGKFRLFGFSVEEIDGHDMPVIVKALENTRKKDCKPKVIIARTVKGKGVDFMENQLGWHGSVPNDEQYESAVRQIKDKGRVS